MNTKIIDRTRTFKAVLFAGILSSSIGWATDAAAEHSFFCKATSEEFRNSSETSLLGRWVYDMGILGSCTGVQQTNPLQKPKKCDEPAKSACKAKAQTDATYNDPTFWCAKGFADGTRIKAYWAVGKNGVYNEIDSGRVLVNKPGATKTTYDCDKYPGTWLDNPSAGNGYHARCVKNSCNAIGGVPGPSWLSIGAPWSSAQGTWITDGSGNIWYGVPAHATITVVGLPECRWQ